MDDTHTCVSYGTPAVFPRLLLGWVHCPCFTQEEPAGPPPHVIQGARPALSPAHSVTHRCSLWPYWSHVTGGSPVCWPRSIGLPLLPLE